MTRDHGLNSPALRRPDWLLRGSNRAELRMVAIRLPTFSIPLAVTLVNGLWYISLMGPYATNRHGPIAVCYSLIYGAAGSGLAYAGAAWIGPRGEASALLGAECATAVVVMHAALRTADTQTSQFAKALARPPIGMSSSFLEIIWRRPASADAGSDSIG